MSNAISQTMTERESRLRTAFFYVSGMTLFIVVAYGIYLLQLQAKRSSCQNNLRQIGQALAMYAADNDDTFPNTNVWWRENDGKFARCPSLVPPTVPKDRPWVHIDHVPMEGYAANTEFAQLIPVKRSEVLFPAHAVLAHEFSEYEPEQGAIRHSGGANYLFVDGHTEWLVPKGVRRLETQVVKHPKGLIPDFYVR